MKSKYESVYGLRDKQRILCHRCQKTHVIVYVNPGDKPKPLCYQCKRFEREHHRDTFAEEADNALGVFAKNMMTNHGCSEVKVFKPGDRGFKQREKEFFDRRKEKRKKVYHYNTFGR